MIAFLLKVQGQIKIELKIEKVTILRQFPVNLIIYQLHNQLT